jgi:hypothetical protein
MNGRMALGDGWGVIFTWSKWWDKLGAEKHMMLE